MEALFSVYPIREETGNTTETKKLINIVARMLPNQCFFSSSTLHQKTKLSTLHIIFICLVIPVQMLCSITTVFIRNSLFRENGN